MIYNNKLIPNVGNCFKVDNQYRLTCPIDSKFEEIEIGSEIIKTSPNHFIIGNKFEVILNSETKKNIINNMFSNDDQIAIILNYQDSKTAKNKEIYNLMQSWRKWISEKITELSNI